MLETPADAIVRSPWGRFTTTGSAVVWCLSRTICGAHVWGRPDADETRAILRLFDQYPRIMDETFDVFLDTRGVEAVDGEALPVLIAWMVQNRMALFERVRISSVISHAPTGFLLAGLLPTIAHNPTFRVSTDPIDAFRAALGDPGAALAEEIEAIAARVRSVPPRLRVVRATLTARLDAPIEDVAKAAGMSPRSLQRWLATHATSFHHEVVSARFAAACELLSSTDLDVATTAARVGLSGRAMISLFRARTGKTPLEWRRSPA